MSRRLSTRNISSKSMHAFLSKPNLANRQTDRQTNTGKTCTSSFVGGNDTKRRAVSLRQLSVLLQNASSRGSETSTVASRNASRRALEPLWNMQSLGAASRLCVPHRCQQLRRRPRSKSANTPDVPSRRCVVIADRTLIN